MTTTTTSRPFELVTPLKPTGDQPEAIDALVAGLQAGHRALTLRGATGSGKTFTMANIVARYQRPTLVLAPNRTLAAQLTAEFRDLFPNKPPEGLLPTCAQAGILGALTGIMGSMQAMEVIKEITGAGESLAGRLILYDARAGRFDTMRFKAGDR